MADIWTTRPTIAPGDYTPAIGKQAKDTDIPAYYSVMESGLYMAYAGAPRAYALGAGAGGATRFEIHQGDRNFADQATHKDCDRGELMARDDTQIPVGQAFNVSVDHMIEAGDPNTAKWFLLQQFHQDISDTALPGSPPVALEMVGERLQLRIRWGKNGNDGQAGNFNKVIWTDSADIVRGQKFRITLAGIFDPAAGALNVSKDGGPVTKYRGPIGYGTAVYLAHGIYRATSPEVMAVQQKIANWWLSPLVL